MDQKVAEALSLLSLSHTHYPLTYLPTYLATYLSYLSYLSI